MLLSSQASKPLSTAELFSKYKAKNINQALRCAAVNGKHHDVYAILKQYSSAVPTQKNTSTPPKSAIDYAFDRHRFDVIAAIAKARPNKLTLGLIMLGLLKFKENLKNLAPKKIMKYYQTIALIYPSYAKKAQQIHPEIAKLYHEVTKRLASYYLKQQQSERFSACLLAQPLISSQLDSQLIRERFQASQSDPDTAFAYALGLVHDDPNVVFWIYEMFLWKKISPDKFLQFFEWFYEAVPNHPHYNIIRNNLALCYRLMYYHTFNAQYAKQCLKLYTELHHPKLQEFKFEYESFESHSAKQNKDLRELAQLYAFQSYYLENPATPASTNLTVNQAEESTIRRMIRQNKPLLKILDAVEASEFAISPTLVLELLAHTLTACRKKLALRERIVSKSATILKLVQHFTEHFDTYSPQQQVDCFHKLSQLPLLKENIKAHLFAVCDRLLVPTLMQYSLRQRLKLISAFVHFKFGIEDYSKVWRLIIGSTLRLELDAHEQTTSDHIDKAYTLSMLAIMLSVKRVGIPQTIQHSIKRSIEKINQTKENIKDHYLYKIFHIANFMRRTQSLFETINEPLQKRCQRHIENLQLNTAISPLQDHFEAFLQAAGIEYEAEAIINGLPVDFLLPEFNVIIQINGRRHYEFSADDNELIAMDHWHNFQVGGMRMVSGHLDDDGIVHVGLTEADYNVIQIDYTQISSAPKDDYEEQRKYWQPLFGDSVLFCSAPAKQAAISML